MSVVTDILTALRTITEDTITAIRDTPRALVSMVKAIPDVLDDPWMWLIMAGWAISFALVVWGASGGDLG